MATKLPSQEEFEKWTAFQVADLLKQVLYVYVRLETVQFIFS